MRTQWDQVRAGAEVVQGQGSILVREAISLLGPQGPPFFLLLAVEQDCHDEGLPRDARPMAISTVPLLSSSKIPQGPPQSSSQHPGKDNLGLS